MTQSPNYDALFAGIIGKEYEMLKLICPLMTEMSRLVGETVKTHRPTHSGLNIVELGGGTGITTLALLTARDDSHITSIDNEPAIIIVEIVTIHSSCAFSFFS
jgi:spermidine synthase